MKPETIKRLEALKQRATAYEVVIETGFERYRLCYWRKSGRGLRDACRVYLNEIREATGLATELPMFARHPQWPDGVITVGEWTIHYSGRTEREAISTESELPKFGKRNESEGQA